MRKCTPEELEEVEAYFRGPSVLEKALAAWFVRLFWISVGVIIAYAAMLLK